MNKYLLRIKSLTDALIAIGIPITTKEHIESIFEGLLNEYDPFECAVNSHQVPFTINEVESLLLALEVRFERNIVTRSEIISVSVASSDVKGKHSNRNSRNNQNFGNVCHVTCPYAHSQNGIVECKHRHVVETRLTLLAHAKF